VSHSITTPAADCFRFESNAVDEFQTGWRPRGPSGWQRAWRPVTLEATVCANTARDCRRAIANESSTHAPKTGRSVLPIFQARLLASHHYRPHRLTDSNLVQIWFNAVSTELTTMVTFKKFIGDESGATAIEYGLIAAGIAVAIITVVQGLGTKLTSTFTSVQGALK
jgi:pilus assembly protein Flp/PilA